MTMIDSFKSPATETGELARALVLPSLICAAGVALFWTLPANAQQVSCDRAATAAEFTICNSEDLQSLDERLGKVFAASYAAQPTLPQRQAVSRQHGEWLKQRNECGGDPTCIAIRYEERLSGISVPGQS